MKIKPPVKNKSMQTEVGQNGNEMRNIETKKHSLKTRQKISESMKLHNLALREGLLTNAYITAHTDIQVKCKKLSMLFDSIVRAFVELSMAVANRICTDGLDSDSALEPNSNKDTKDIEYE